MKRMKCEEACTRTYKGGDSESEKKLEFLKKGMAFNYQHHWIVGKISITKTKVIEIEMILELTIYISIFS